MSLVILMRHAKAVRDHEAPSDEARGLTERGRDDSRAAAAAMRAQGFRPADIVCSTAARTMATARLVMEASGDMRRLVPDDALYLAEPEAIWAGLRRTMGEDGILLVGHNPGLHSLVTRWIARANDRSALAQAFVGGLATAAWAAFDVENMPAESVSPKLLGGWAPKGL